MNRPPRTIINETLCTGCGQCIRVCPCNTLSLKDGKATVTGNDSMYCGHCAATCPTGAVTVTCLDEGSITYSTFEAKKSWLPHGHHDTASLVNLMASRRSCRNYLPRKVAPGVLEDLVKIGTTAPSGTNSQMWTFRIVPDRKSMDAFGGLVCDFFKALNQAAEKRWLRLLLKLMGKTQLDQYHNTYYHSVKESIEGWEKHKQDRLFHGAVSAILVGALPGASCPGEDALLATQNILLAAHSMGLGSCLIGFAVEAMKHAPNIKKQMGIPKDETIYAVIALGYPDETYTRVAERKKATAGYFSI